MEHLKKLSRDEELYQRAFSGQINLVAYNLDRAGLLEEGIKKGQQEGKFNKQKEIALNMLSKKLKIPLISEVTGLSVSEIKRLNK